MNEPFPAVVRLQISRELDISNKDDLRAALLPSKSADHVIIDMTGTTYIDSSALYCLIYLKQQLNRTQRRHNSVSWRSSGRS